MRTRDGNHLQLASDTVLTRSTQSAYRPEVSSHLSRDRMDSQPAIKQMVAHMRVLKLSEITISSRLDVLYRLIAYLEAPLLEATPAMLYSYQKTYAHLAPASVNIYTRHMREFYVWATKAGLLDVNPAIDLSVPKVHRGRPHPTLPDDMRTIFSCAQNYLRTAYILAAFAGLRCGEISRLNSRDLYLESDAPTALIRGKGGKERYVPLLAPVVAEIGYKRNWICVNSFGRQLTPKRLSAESSKFLAELGVNTTLHSLRHYFGTEAYRVTHDPLLVRDLMGHESVATTEVYTDSNMDGAHGKLVGLGNSAERLLRNRHLVAVGGG